MCIFLCTIIIYFAVAIPKVEASVIAVTAGTSAVLGTVITGLGVTAVNGIPMDDFLNNDSVDRNMFLQGIYSKLSDSTKAELESASKASVGEDGLIKFELSAKSIKDIFAQISNYLVTNEEEDEFLESGNYNFVPNAFYLMEESYKKRIDTGEVDSFGNAIYTNVFYFPGLQSRAQFESNVTNSIFDYITFFKNIASDGQYKPSGVLHSPTKFSMKIDGDFKYKSFESQGYELVQCYPLAPIAGDPLDARTLDPQNDYFKVYNTGDINTYRSIGEFTNKAGGKIKLEYRMSLHVEMRGSTKYVVESSGFKVGNYTRGTSAYHNWLEKCPIHNIEHLQYRFLYVFYRELDNSYYVDSNVGSINNDVFCHYFFEPSSLLKIDGSTAFYSEPLKKNKEFSIATTGTIGSIGTQVGNMEDDKKILVNIPTVDEGKKIVIPTDKTEIMDMTTVGGGTTTNPDTDIDIPDLNIPKIFTKFPFSIPYDIYLIFASLNAPPVVPKFEIPLVTEKVVLDFSVFNEGAKVVKWLLYAFFVYGLILKTRALIKG